MKSSLVPAQITNVEDKITGRLSFTQLLLLIAPVMLTGALFTLFPPSLSLSPFKLVVSAILGTICVLLAVRIKGTLVIHWLVTIVRYNSRPRHHVYNKNDLYLRRRPSQIVPEVQEKTVLADISVPRRHGVALPELMRLQHSIVDPRSKFQVTVEKGALYVHIHEIKEETV